MAQKFDNDMAYFETFKMERAGLIDNESAQIQRSLLWQIHHEEWAARNLLKPLEPA